MMALALGVIAGTVPWLWTIKGSEPVVRSPRPRRSLSAAVPLLFAALGWPVIAVACGVAIVAVPPLRRRAIAVHRRRMQVAAVPDTLEVLAIGVSVGMTLELLVDFATRCAPSATRPWFRHAQRSLAVGHGRRTVLAALADEGGPEMASVAEVLISSDRDGAPVALVLDRLAVEANRLNRLAAEERARRIPVLMLAPLSLCSLPAVMIGTLFPFVLLSFGQTSF
ncbi:MAG: type II secretion system F family protein [Acidimicrobiales bacterium]|nr:type II secretion system F family protein [Acidimicrobiales bacterium]